MADQTVSQKYIFQAVKAILGGSLAHTLAECIHWSQYAGYSVDGDPLIWKTGKGLGAELGLSARTANAHLKKLAKAGYWQIEYKPRPGHPSKVTWLRFLGPSSSVLALARQLQQESAGGNRKGKKQPVQGVKGSSVKVLEPDLQQSQNETSKHFETTPQTSNGQNKSFLLSKEQKEFPGKKEAFKLSEKSEEGENEKVEKLKSPKYEKASESQESFATLIKGLLKTRKLPPWDWSSGYTWKHTKEIHDKLQKHGLQSESDWLTFGERLCTEWHWLRTVMADRYKYHELNVHRPTPMALAFDFDKLFECIRDKYNPKPKPTKSSWSSFDEGM
jgi:hypothetical protein